MFDFDPIEFVASHDSLQVLDDVFGIQSVPLRISKSAVETLTLLAAKEGLLLQAYVRKVLQNHVYNTRSPQQVYSD